jgi:hypothetical protein
MYELYKDLKKNHIPFEYYDDDGISKIIVGPFFTKSSEGKIMQKTIRSLCKKHNVSMSVNLSTKSLANIISGEAGDPKEKNYYIYIFDVSEEDFKKYELQQYLFWNIHNKNILCERRGPGNKPCKEIMFLADRTFSSFDDYLEHQDRLKACIPEMLEKTWHPDRVEKWCL